MLSLARAGVARTTPASRSRAARTSSTVTVIGPTVWWRLPMARVDPYTLSAHRCPLAGVLRWIIQQRRGSAVRTFSPTPSDIQRAWYVVDADGLVLGRLA